MSGEKRKINLAVAAVGGIMVLSSVVNFILNEVDKAIKSKRTKWEGFRDDGKKTK